MSAVPLRSLFLATPTGIAPGVNTQKLTAIQMGYNLGPVALTVGVARNKDLNGTAGNDSDMIMTRLIGAF